MQLAKVPAHKNLIRYYNAWIENGEAFVVLELCRGGCLSDIRFPGLILNQSKLLDAFKCVLSVRYIY